MSRRFHLRAIFPPVPAGDRRAQSRSLRAEAGQKGQALTEYILVIGIIVIPIAVAFNQFQPVLKKFLNAINTLLSGPGI